MNAVAKLPGIGKKTALRLVLHLVREEKGQTAELTRALNQLREGIRFCNTCYNISDTEICGICSSHKRDQTTVCIVEDPRDVMAIENTAQYTGVYHVLGGVISPINGIGPSDLRIEPLVDRLHQKTSTIQEIILALSPTMEGDTTAFYIHRRLKDLPIRITAIARGVPIGGDLEYADEITLGRSIQSRTLFT